MDFEISQELFELLPNACFGVVAARGINNRLPIAEIDELLSSHIVSCERDFTNVKVKEAPDIVCYREAFRSLGMNPNKFMCSIEALISRVAKGKGFPKINGIVDLGNAVSLKYHLPIGAHDMSTIPNKLCVRPGVAEDTFIPFGETEKEKPDINEIVYVSEHEVRTRRWTWRQSEIGKITEETENVLFPIDGFSGINEDKVIKARDELAEYLHTFFHCETVKGFIDKEHPVFHAVF